MELVINQETLKEELSFMQGIVEKKAAVTALSNILLQSVGEDKVRMTGSNMEITMHVYAPAQVFEKGAVLIGAKKIFDIARLLDSSEVRFQAEENSWVRVESGNAKFRVASLDVKEYPDVPISAKTNLELTSDLILSFIQMTSFAMSQEQSRYLLSAAKFLSVDEAGNRKKLRMVTTDGHRLAMVEKAFNGSDSHKTDSAESLSEVGDLDILIPKRALQELAKICRSVEKVELGEDERHLYFGCGSRSLIVRKLVGNFPNYEAVIPKESPFRAEFDVSVLRSALRRVSLMADEMSHAVKITLRKNEALIEAFSQDGQAQETIPAVYDGDLFTIGFNSQYIQEFLDVVLSVSGSFSEAVEEVEKEVESDKVKVKASEGKRRISFEFRDSNSQVVMRPLGLKDYNYVYVVMPLRL